MDSTARDEAVVAKLMALADSFAVASIYASCAAVTLHRTDADPDKAKAALTAAIREAVSLGEPVAWVSKDALAAVKQADLLPESAFLSKRATDAFNVALYTAPGVKP